MSIIDNLVVIRDDLHQLMKKFVFSLFDLAEGVIENKMHVLTLNVNEIFSNILEELKHRINIAPYDSLSLIVKNNNNLKLIKEDIRSVNDIIANDSRDVVKLKELKDKLKIEVNAKIVNRKEINKLRAHIRYYEKIKSKLEI